MLREALKISSPPALVSREVPRFHGGSLWHSTSEGFSVAFNKCKLNVNNCIKKGKTLFRLK